MILREKVLSAFRPGEGYTYSHVLPFQYSNFIDGMAWVSILAGAAAKVKDDEVLFNCENFLNNLITAGNDARNFATFQVKDSWVKSKTVPDIWVKEKAQAFAGRAALYWAIKQGADVDPESLTQPLTLAKLLCAIAPLYGHCLQPFSWTRQHINSVMFAHLLLNEVPPASMEFLAENNMLYSYLYCKRCDAPYRNTGAWAAKDYPLDPPDEKTDVEYTPVCELAARMLQSTL